MPMVSAAFGYQGYDIPIGAVGGPTPVSQFLMGLGPSRRDEIGLRFQRAADTEVAFSVVPVSP